MEGRGITRGLGKCEVKIRGGNREECGNYGIRKLEVKLGYGNENIMDIVWGITLGRGGEGL
jgi:hypothetical protein